MIRSMALFICLSVCLPWQAFSDSRASSQKTVLGRLLSPVSLEIQDCFANAYYDAGIYSEGWCNRNTRNLYLKCFSGVPRDGHVLYLMTVSSEDQLKQDTPTQEIYPKLARSGTDIWSFHTFLENEGNIFDLDFTHRPEITNVFDYFHRMFDVPRTKIKYVVRVIGAKDYGANYDDADKNWIYYIHNSSGFYPLEDVIHYLKNFKGDVSTALDHMTVPLH